MWVVPVPPRPQEDAHGQATCARAGMVLWGRQSPVWGSFRPLQKVLCGDRQVSLSTRSSKKHDRTFQPESKAWHFLFLIKSLRLTRGQDQAPVFKNAPFWIESPEQKVLINSRHADTVRHGGSLPG